MSSERILSTAGNVVSPKRSYFSPQNVNHLLFLHEIRNSVLGIFVQFCVQGFIQGGRPGIPPPEQIDRNIISIMNVDVHYRK